MKKQKDTRKYTMELTDEEARELIAGRYMKSMSFYLSLKSGRKCGRHVASEIEKMKQQESNLKLHSLLSLKERIEMICENPDHFLRLEINNMEQEIDRLEYECSDDEK